jgi:hypothetical protein
MFSHPLSIRAAARRAAWAAALVVLAAPAVAPAQSGAPSLPVTGAQRQTADEVAQAGVPLSALAASAPDEYTVKAGDTLWGISSIFLTSPWRWPELWGMNKAQIANPHLIYPGQVLRLVRIDGRARLELAQGGQPADVVRLSPKVRDLGGEREAIPSIPNRVIEPFLSRPAIISPDELDRFARFIATQDERVYVGVGDTAYARGIADDGIERFAIFRPARPLFDPDDVERRRPIAYEAFYLGLAQMIRGGEVATLRILESKEEIGIGDRLAPVTRIPVINYVPRRPDAPIEGRLVSIYSGLTETGTQSIVTLNRGARHGVKIGYVLELLDRGAVVLDRTGARGEYVKLPDERIGHMFVFRVFDEISYALVLRVTKPVKVGDRFVEPE